MKIDADETELFRSTEFALTRRDWYKQKRDGLFDLLCFDAITFFIKPKL